MSFFIGEIFPMIHSMMRRGIDRIRYPITVMHTKIKRIIKCPFQVSGNPCIHWYGGCESRCSAVG